MAIREKNHIKIIHRLLGLPEPCEHTSQQQLLSAPPRHATPRYATPCLLFRFCRRSRPNSIISTDGLSSCSSSRPTASSSPPTQYNTLVTLRVLNDFVASGPWLQETAVAVAPLCFTHGAFLLSVWSALFNCRLAKVCASLSLVCSLQLPPGLKCVARAIHARAHDAERALGFSLSFFSLPPLSMCDYYRYCFGLGLGVWPTGSLPAP